MQISWLVLIPPLLVVVLAILTRRIVFSLGVSILSAALILHEFQLKTALTTVGLRIWNATELGYLTSWESFWSAWYLFICLFLIILGIMIELITQTGGAFAYGEALRNRLKNVKNAEVASLLMSHLFFVDDYFGSLTVGSVMQPITDQFKIPRVKLALLVSAIAAPLAVLCPISSWSADIIMQLRQSGISTIIQDGTVLLADPFYTYLLAIPFLFYALITLASLWFTVLTRTSYGTLKSHEQEATRTGNLFGGKITLARRTKAIDAAQMHRSSIWDFLLPLITLFITVIIGIACLGFGRIPIALFLGSCCATLVGMVYLFMRKKLKISMIPNVLRSGAMLMLPSIMVLVLIWTLSALLKNDLATGKYLAELLIGHITISLLPGIFFLLATLISATMGSAWGTIGLLIAIAIPMLTSFVPGAIPVTPDQVAIVFPLIAAIISGAVAGNHLSPIADIMLLSSASAGSYHFDLVKAQIQFALPSVIASAIAFFMAGFMIQSYGILMTACSAATLGIVTSITMMKVVSRLS